MMSLTCFPARRFTSAWRAVIALVMVVTIACDDDEPPATDPPTSPPIPSGPVLTVAPGALEFGPVGIGSQSGSQVMLSNDGAADLSVTYALSGDSSFSLADGPGQLTLEPGEAHTLTVYFAPVVGGLVEGSLDLTSNDESNAAIQVPLSGEGTYADEDADGYPTDVDCNDDDSTVYPGANELCDGKDNDCDTIADNDLLSLYYADADQDGYGDASVFLEACSTPAGFTDNGSDCDDASPKVYPGAMELCDGKDNDCDGAVDDADLISPMPADNPSPYAPPTWYLDADDDGYGADDSAVVACEGSEGYVPDGGDCNDDDPAYFPGAPETDCSDFHDYNCDGSVAYADADGDGFAACQECDDANSTIYPGSPEVCDGFDNDCNGTTDEGVTVEYYLDADADGFGSLEAMAACSLPEGYAENSADCDDTEPSVYPDAPELCDTLDNDCDGYTDDEDTLPPTPLETQPPNQPPVWYLDEDLDGYGTDSSAVMSCVAPDGFVPLGGDCNDADPAFHPQAEEPDCTDPLDYNCDGETAYADADGDGFLACLECDDSSELSYPGALEVCDGKDNNCDGTVDEGVTTPFFEDWDADGYGNPDGVLEACSPPSGFTDNAEDCDDSSGAVYPFADEWCDGQDNDCDEDVDESDAVDVLTWYPDGDLDGFGVDEDTIVACNAPASYALYSGDCNDADPLYHPGASESDCTDPNDYNCDGSVAYSDSDGDGVPACEDCNDGSSASFPGNPESCDGLDNDCNGSIDEGVKLPFYVDADNDTYGSAGSAVYACQAPEGYVANNTDCNDQSSSVNPGALEQCNDRDDDCDGVIDEPSAEGCTMIYHDADGDTFGSSTSSCECDLRLGWTTKPGDCNDTNAAVFPGATEKCNGYDDDCDSASDEIDAQGCSRLYADQDQDLWGSMTNYACVCGPTGVYTTSIYGDCLDTDATVYPNAPESCDEKDNNCNGQTDEGVKNTYYPDYDGDGFGALYNAKEACKPPSGYVAQGGDCNDYNNTISPGSPEICDSADNDCDGAVDEGIAKVTVYKDNDGDGHGATGIPGVGACLSDEDGDGVGETPPLTYSLVNDDCNDSDVTIFPGAAESCDGKDNDCDGTTDKLCFSEAEGYWPFHLDYSQSNSAARPVDLNGDGYFEVVVQDAFGFAILDYQGVPLFNYSAANYNYSRGQALLADVDSYDTFGADAQTLEVLTGNGSYPKIYKLNGDQTVTTYTSSQGIYDASRFMATDLDYDGRIEWFTTTWCEGAAAVRIFRFNKSSLAIEHAAAIADPDNTCDYTDGRVLTDLNADGTSELLFGNGYAYATSPSVWGGHIFAFTPVNTATPTYDYFCAKGSCFKTDITGLYGGAVGDLFRTGDQINADVLYFTSNIVNAQNPSTYRYWNFDLQGQPLSGSPASSRPAPWYPTDVNDDGTLESISTVMEYGLFDVNADGYPDQIFTSGTELRIALWNNTQKAFAEHIPSRKSISSANVGLRGIWDMNGDGRLEVIAVDTNGNVFCYSLGAGTFNRASSLPPYFPLYLRTYQWDNYEPNDGLDTNSDLVPDRVIRVASALTRKGNFYSYLSKSTDKDFYMVDAAWGGQICLVAPKNRIYKLNVYSYFDRWNNSTHDPTADGLKDGLIWSSNTPRGGQVCFYGSSVTPYRYGEYKFVVGVETASGDYSPYWPYWLSVPK